MNELRCSKCNKLLMRDNEIKCNRCGHIEPTQINFNSSIATLVTAARNVMKIKPSVITIEVFGGVVTSVKGMPRGWKYTIIDRDDELTNKGDRPR